MKDYYLILGVLPDAEDVVIKAAYKALVQRYHPDRFQGSAEEAQRRTRELNEAYEVLSNPAKRADYDRQRQAQKNGSTSDYDEDEAGSEDLNDALAEMAADWRFALDYYPDLAQLEADLQRLSTKLGLAFKLVMLSDKQFDKRSQVAKALENKFLETHFGSNKEVQALAKRFILDRNQAAARELNKVVVILGSKSDPRQLISRMWQKYYPKEPYVYAREKSGVERKLDTTITTVKQLLLKLLAIGFVGFLVIVIVSFFIELNKERGHRERLQESQKTEQEKLKNMILQPNGTVLDKNTGLEWMACSVGQVWDGSSCEGEVKKLFWHDAIKFQQSFSGKSDWRLPTQHELLTIRYCSQGIDLIRCAAGSSVPTINQQVFPNTYAGDYWSLSSSVKFTYDALDIGLGYMGNKEVGLAVRLVRNQ